MFGCHVSFSSQAPQLDGLAFGRRPFGFLPTNHSGQMRGIAAVHRRSLSAEDEIKIMVEECPVPFMMQLGLICRGCKRHEAKGISATKKAFVHRPPEAPRVHNGRDWKSLPHQYEGHSARAIKL